ncbi:putative Sensor histidine kinase/response regulator [Taphrina deformans PYCC 5710]|uniref:Sensor histidine kinase/response regulator n=1 Tax=Taphrina deformans (strain PYCC 5710 / ATCC 11124 / CBS 356.35 / IMI 108563 / JCM 9778 / NBRC 8474) TaxID=1097556 RepID=R4XE51_TAPDE|nr:putative Sensor histidine kinase/response regulator [Taphrina deformans PYCC 5710]|eukprot:CCG81618.1 putative Sensor histidine kinase/response regulator [Taphrina deformans PYCC 5710]
MDSVNEKSGDGNLTITLATGQHARSLHDYRDAALHAIDFERYSRLIRSLLRTEVGVITFLDEAHQYVLAQSNSTNDEIIPQILPREATVCQYTVQQNERAFVVEDLSQHDKFRSLACVQTGPKLRSYAGFPIRTGEGYNIGSVCALDDHTRGWSQDELELLRDLGRMITNDLDLHFQKKTILMQQKLQNSIVSFIESNMKSNTSASAPLSSVESSIGHNAAVIVREALVLDSVVILQLDRRTHSRSCTKFITEVIGRDGQAPSAGSCLADDISALCESFKTGKSSTMSYSSNFPKAVSKLVGAQAGSVIIVSWADADGRLAGFLMAHSNSTARVFLEYERDYLAAFGSTLMLELQKARVIDADKDKARFISSLSHELRTPLHGLLLNAEVLRESSLDSEQADLIKEVIACGNAQLSIVESMLSLNRAKQRSGVDTSVGFTEAIDVVQVVEDAVTLANNRHRRRSHKVAKEDTSHTRNNVQIVVDCALSQSDQHLRYRLSNGKCLASIVEQLVSNSLKWTATGFIKIGISFTTSGDVPKVLIDVCDTGSGIHQDFIKHKLFEMFTKEDNFSFGLGLGLTLVAESMAQLKGEITVDSEKGAYTTVHLAIPMPFNHDVSKSMGPAISAIDTIGVLCPEVSDSVGTNLLAQTLVRDIKALGYNVRTYSHVPEEGPSVLFAVEHVFLASLRKQVKDSRIVYTGQAAFAMPPGPMRHLSYQLGPHYAPHMLASLLTQIERDVDMSSHALLQAADQMSRKRPRSMSRDPQVKIAHISPLSQNDRITKIRKQENFVDGQEVRDSSTPVVIDQLKLEPAEMDQPDLITQSTAVTPVRSASQHDVLTASSLPSSPRVLIVEDNPTNSRLLERFMQKRGVVYTAVVNGQEAVEEIDSIGTGDKQAYDMILMDIQMPVLDGLEATERIRRIETSKFMPKAQIIACTGLSAPEDKRRASEVGCDKYLTKPISLVTLKHLFDDWSSGQIGSQSP